MRVACWLVLAAGCSFRAGSTLSAADSAGQDSDAAPIDTKVWLDGPPLTPITYVQGTQSLSSSGMQASLRFPMTVTTGNFLVVIASWANDATITATAVSDDASNTYALAANGVFVVKTLNVVDASMAVFFAWNVHGGSRPTVTIDFLTFASAPELKIAEYSGIETGTSPYDASAFNRDGATSKSMDTGIVMTTHAHDLLIAANAAGDVTDKTDAAFVRRIDLDVNGDIVEDREVTVAGSYTATAHQQNNSWWLFPIFAFRAAN